MNKSIIILLILYLSIIYPLQAQDITNKLGGDTANETYDVTDSADIILLRVQGDGKVGVGTDTPSEALDIDGNIKVSGTVDGVDIATDVTANNAKVTDDDDGVAEVYSSGWDSDNEAPTKNDVYDKVESFSSGTDDQKIDVFSISGNNVQLSVETDGEATKTIDISTTTAVTANTAKATDDDDGVVGAYGAGWNADTDSPTKDAVYDKIESLPGGHDAVTIGTANGLSLSTQQISLSTATTSAAGAMSSSDKTKLDGLSSGGNTLDQAYDQGGAGAGRTITADNGAFKVDGVDGALFTGTYGTGIIPATGAGSRMMWYPNKAAFRVGRVTGIQWDDANIGDYSTAIGYNNEASGNYSTAMGYETTASADYSTAIGRGTNATEFNSFAMGRSTTASGGRSVASGYGSTASGSVAFALGAYTLASGTGSVSMGFHTKAESQYSVVLGKYNVGGGTTDSWVDAEPLFEIGIGTDDANRANAVTVLKNGNVGIGNDNPATKLDVNGIITSTGGNSTEWNTAYDWGDHGTEGYLKTYSETDPQVGAISTSHIPRWNGSALVTGKIYDNGTKVGIGTIAPDANFQVNGTVKILGDVVKTYSMGTTYTASTDGFVIVEGYGTYGDNELVTVYISVGYGTSDAYIVHDRANGDGNDIMVSAIVPVKKGYTFKIYGDGIGLLNIVWIPFGL